MEPFLNKENRGYFLRLFLQVAILFIVVSGAVYFLGIQSLVNKQKLIFKANQEQKVLAEKNLMEHLLDEAVLDLMTMSQSEMFRLFFTKKIENPSYQNYFTEMLEELFKQKSSYYQLRFLDLKGMEVFRIDRVNGEPHVCSTDELQDKSRRYYFQEAIKLEKGDFYVSPFDLNIEHGEIEKPYRPMIRICIPVFNNEGDKLGVNILNYDGSGFIAELDEQQEGREGISYLINEDGYFLNADKPALEWGFMFQEKKSVTLEQIFPNDYEQIEQTDAGQLETPSGLFTIETVNPFKWVGDLDYSLSKNSHYSWKAISFVSGGKLFWSEFVPLSRLLWLYVVILIIGLVVAFYYSDLSLRKKMAQQALVESERRLKLANKTKDQFFSIISHDLKNASGTIANYLDFMQEGYDDFTEDEKKVHLKDVTFAASQHNKLLYSILDWAQLQKEGDRNFKPGLFRVAELFKEQADLFELQLRNKGLNISISCDENLQALADRDMVQTVIRNLVNNAIKFSHRDGTIVLSGESKSEKVELKVIDQGIGMRESDAEKIFDLYSKVQQPGTENESGTGFGLKLVSELVLKNQGTIRVESELGVGSAFIVSLPSGN